MTRASDSPDIILVEDDSVLREAVLQALELAGFVVDAFDSAVRALRYVLPSFCGCVVTDLRMDGMDGLQLFSRIRELDAEIPVILMTGHGDVAMAVRAMHDGAFDFLAKPFASDHLVATVRRALQSRRLVLDNRALRKAIADVPDGMVAQSRAAALLRANVTQVALTRLDVLIEGEAGVGKEYWARHIHRQSNRCAQPFVVLSAAFAAAMQDIVQAVDACAGGTLYLDDCDALPVAQQVRLAALLDARDRADSDVPGFRLVAALRHASQQASIDERLAQRIGALRLRVPPLRERRDDIPLLFAAFAREALDQMGRKRFEMSASDRKRLIEYDWPGNVRELRSYAFAAVLNLSRSTPRTADELPNTDLPTRVAQFERMCIVEALETTQGSVVRACSLLSTPRKTLYEKLARHGIDPAMFRRRA